MPATRRPTATGDLPAGPIVVPAAELTERFSRSSGPGGQSVNTADSRVELSWDIGTSAALSEAQRARLQARLANRLAGDVLTMAAAEHRSQLRNREAARARLAALVAAALAVERPRRPTRPSRAAREARLAAKRRRAEIKSARRVRPDD